jgi:8-amino-7-oxononanoate synthase
MTSIDSFANSEVEKLQLENICRKLTKNIKSDSGKLIHNNKEVINLCSNDYFALATHPSLKKAAIAAIEQDGLGATASRLLTGNHPYYEKLEQKISKYKNTQKTIIFGSGYLTAIGVIPALVDRKDVIIADKNIHASLLDAARLSRAKILRFKHNSLESCKKILAENRKKYNKCLIISETVFSMDGDLGPVAKLAELAKEYDAWLLTDDAHGFAIVKNNIAKDFKNHIQLGTLSKTIGCYGGYVTGSAALADLITTKSRSLIYSTALPASIIAAAIAAVDYINQHQHLGEKLLAKTQDFCRKYKLPYKGSQIIIKEFQTIKDAQKLQDLLLQHGYLSALIKPPTAYTPRIRVSMLLNQNAC